MTILRRVTRFEKVEGYGMESPEKRKERLAKVLQFRKKQDCPCGYKLPHKAPGECAKSTISMWCPCTPPKHLAEGERCPDCGSKVGA